MRLPKLPIVSRASLEAERMRGDFWLDRSIEYGNAAFEANKVLDGGQLSGMNPYAREFFERVRARGAPPSH